MIGDDVIGENLAELVIGYARHRPVIGIGGGVADERRHLAKGGHSGVNEGL